MFISLLAEGSGVARGKNGEKIEIFFKKLVLF